ncbi:hypothetical protein BH11BAC5_BH11BAC5_10400 [soil metagenome]
MANKKYKLIIGFFALITTTSFAQMGSGYSVFDSSVIPAKKLPQQNEFMNNTYNFPAKPRNMVEVGVSVGNIVVMGDVAGRVPRLGFEAHVRKALGYIFSLRAQYINGSPKGMNWQPSYNYANNDALVSGPSGNLPAGKGYTPNVDPVFYNYKTHVQDLGIQGIFTLNNVRFHKQKTGFTVYAGGGVGATWYNVMVNALDASGNNYASLYNSIASGGDITYSNRKNILKRLKNGMDNTYETPGESEGSRRPKLGKNTLRPSGTILAGVAVKLSNRVNIALEDRHTFVKSDLLDGQRWQEHPAGLDAALTPDYDSYNYLSLGINFNLGAKAVEPLWWLNPLDYAYSEINNPKHMKLPKPILDDTDGDGVTDQLDREPNTPAGCPVDSHGVTRDTDGDGVPDCKDKQLITPTECQPVDADGVGKCPDPACCTAINAKLDSANACASDYPSLSVKSATLKADTKALLATVANKLKEKPNCTITLTAYPAASKKEQSLADKKLDAVKNYLVEKLGISPDRVLVDKVIGGGDSNTIDIKSN